MWYYGVNNQPIGPVSEDQIKELIQQGKINGQTKVWQMGMVDWQILSSTSLAAFLPSVPPPVSRVLTPGLRAVPVKRRKIRNLFIWWISLFGITALLLLFFYVLGLLNYSQVNELVSKSVGLVCLAYIPVIAGSILTFILLYQFWRVVQDGFASINPERAIGFLFIPFFNYYWVFRAFWGLSKELNQYIDRHFSPSAEPSVRRAHPWIALTQLIFTYGGMVIYFVAIFSVSFMSIYNSALSNTSHNNPYLINSSLTTVITIISMVYLFGSFLLSFCMFIDFFKTTDSILRAEGQE